MNTKNGTRRRTNIIVGTHLASSTPAVYLLIHTHARTLVCLYTYMCVCVYSIPVELPCNPRGAPGNPLAARHCVLREKKKREWSS